MLTIYHSNKLDVLKSLMAHIMSSAPLSSPMDKEVIVVQSAGMARWLQIELGQSMGVLANAEFPLPATYLWRLFSLLKQGDTHQEELKFDKLTITWLLMHALPERLEHPEFVGIKRYLADDIQDKKLYHLALKCADLFDHYLVYRPEWTLKWEAGERVGELGEAELWQSILWRDIAENMAQQAIEKDLILTHRASMYDDLITFLKQAPIHSLDVPERLFVCGISALPPLYVSALEALGKHCDVHLMYTNPCRYYWADIQAISTQIRQRLRIPFNQVKSGVLGELANVKLSQTARPPLKEMLNDVHPLLANWGKLARDQLFQFSELTQLQEIDAFVEETKADLLSSIKSDILNLTNRQILGLTQEQLESSHDKLVISPEDRSVSFHVCHSMLREVEVLYDHLLHQFNHYPDLSPKDVVVMVSDVSLYTPYIQAIFGNAPKSRFLPFSIADRGVKATHPIVEVVSQLLQLPNKRFTVEEIMALLSVSALTRTFDMTPDDLFQIQHWIEQTHIYWARDDEWLTAQELPPTGQFTWRFGLDRLLIGLTKSDNSGLWRGIAPYGGGQIAPGLAGQFSEVIERLMLWQDKLSQARSLQAWRGVLTELFSSLFCFSEDEIPLSIVLLEAWDTIIDSGLAVDYTTPVHIDLLHEAWLLHADNDKGNQRFLAGKINFCTLMPMRSIPFKQVCLLGMSETLYPRNIMPVSFDLMNNHTQRGDRSRRDDDRYLFLEAIISAEQTLYISYVGMSIHDNQPKNASLMVTEFLDYLCQSYVLADYQTLSCDESANKMREHFLTVHTRVPYAPENYLSDVRIPSNNKHTHLTESMGSFASEWLNTLNHRFEGDIQFNQPIHFEFDSVIELDMLIRFFNHPVEYYFKSVLGVSLNEHTVAFENQEPFSLDGLAKYGLKKQLFEDKLQGKDYSISSALIRAEGRLPALGAGETILLETDTTINALYTVIQQRFASLLEKQNKKQMVEVALNLEALFTANYIGNIPPMITCFKQLIGWLEIDPNYGLIEWRVGALGANYQFGFWLKHVILCLAEPSDDINKMLKKGMKSTLIGVKGTEVEVIQFELLSKEAATRYLVSVLEYFYLGHQKVVLALPNSCAQYAENSMSTKPRTIPILHLYDQENVYIKRYFAQPALEEPTDEMKQEIIECAKVLYEPLLAQLQ